MKVILIIFGSWINILLIVGIASLFKTGHNKSRLLACLIIGAGLIVTSWLLDWDFVLLAFGGFNIAFSLLFLSSDEGVDDPGLLHPPQEKSGLEYHPKFKS